MSGMEQYLVPAALLLLAGVMPGVLRMRMRQPLRAPARRPSRQTRAKIAGRRT